MAEAADDRQVMRPPAPAGNIEAPASDGDGAARLEGRQDGPAAQAMVACRALYLRTLLPRGTQRFANTENPRGSVHGLPTWLQQDADATDSRATTLSSRCAMRDLRRGLAGPPLI